jgi:hypothetical protein
MQQPADVTTGSTIRCVECGTRPTGLRRAGRRSWAGGFEGEPLEVVVFCPGCVAYEFSDAS